MKEIAIITGGSSGLGFELAKKLLSKEIDVCIVAKNKEKLENAYYLLQQTTQRSNIIKFCADISKEEEVIDLYEYLIKEEYQIRYLFNVAGVGKRKTCEDITNQDINQVLEANLIGLVHMCSHGIKQMKEKNNIATIVTIMSSAALKGNALESIYCAAKWGARGYTESIRAELKGSKIQVVAVYPGGMKTNFWNEQVGEIPDTSKFMEADEVANQIVDSILEKKTILVTDISINRI